MATNKFAEADVIQNRISLALAKSQRIVASWLPPIAQSSTKTEEELEREEAEIFAPMPSRLGLGAPLPDDYKDGTPKSRKELSKDELLRRRMLGKKAGHGSSKPMPSSNGVSGENAVLQESSEDEDEGRTGLGKRKRGQLQNSTTSRSEINVHSKASTRHIEALTQELAEKEEPAAVNGSVVEDSEGRRIEKKKRKKKKKKNKTLEV